MTKKFNAILCDLDGVLTQTARLHAKAWKSLFDEFLIQYGKLKHTSFPEFKISTDYPTYIDGKLRIEGLKSYLKVLNIELPFDTNDRFKDEFTILNLANKKNELFNKLLMEEGVYIYKESINQLKRWKQSGYKIAVVSSSKNCRNILKVSKIENLFDVVVDGQTTENEKLKGKPEPEIFLYTAGILKTTPENVIIVEDAYSGIEAGKKGGFGFVIGIIHNDNGELLYSNGADLVVNNLSEVNLDRPNATSALLDTVDVSGPMYIVKEGFNLDTETSIESILSISNGYIGTRNSLEEYYSFSNPFTCLSGVYSNSNELAKMPDWTRFQFYLDDALMDLFNTETLFHKRYLDLTRGLVFREWKFKDHKRRITTVKIVKYVSIHNKSETFKCAIIQPENYSCKLKFVSGINGEGLNIVGETIDPVVLVVNPDKNGHDVGLIQRSYCSHHTDNYQKKIEENEVYEVWEWIGGLGEKYFIYGIIDFCESTSSYDNNKITLRNLEERLSLHIASWKQFWYQSGIFIKGDNEGQQWVNFALYHLYSAGKFNGGDKSIGARALSGTVYQGHVFWDTEIFLLPFYIFNYPEIARELLMYRYHTLEGAKQNARNENQPGASYAWESSDSGLEVTPTEAIAPYGEIIPIYTGKFEIHITPDVAFAVWYYWRVTEDYEFMINYGVEILIETARFCVGLLKKGDDGLYHINNVIGPDEYHDFINDNAYTNIMVQYNLEIALKALDFLKKNHPDVLTKLKEKTGLSDKETNVWREIKDKFYTGFNPDNKLFEQFKGYFDLEYIDLKSHEPRDMPMDLILGRNKIAKTQVIKQADVLMFLFLMPEYFSKEIIEINFDYYEARASHGSSLSPGIHCALAAKLGKKDLAYKYFEQNAQIDLNEKSRGAVGGIHIASMGGTWLSVIMGFCGMHITDRGIIIDPNLPDKWEEIKFPLCFRRHRISFTVRKFEIFIEVEGEENVEVSVGQNNWNKLTPGLLYTLIKEQKWLWKK